MSSKPRYPPPNVSGKPIKKKGKGDTEFIYTPVEHAVPPAHAVQAAISNPGPSGIKPDPPLLVQDMTEIKLNIGEIRKDIQEIKETVREQNGRIKAMEDAQQRMYEILVLIQKDVSVLRQGAIMRSAPRTEAEGVDNLDWLN